MECLVKNIDTLRKAPMSKVLHKWFESEPLKACLATDAVIGAMMSPHTPGSGYVLLHHVMGGVEGHKNRLRNKISSINQCFKDMRNISYVLAYVY
jgi:hypothetical protein